MKGPQLQRTIRSGTPSTRSARCAAGGSIGVAIMVERAMRDPAVDRVLRPKGQPLGRCRRLPRRDPPRPLASPGRVPDRPVRPTRVDLWHRPPRPEKPPTQRHPPDRPHRAPAPGPARLDAVRRAQRRRRRDRRLHPAVRIRPGDPRPGRLGGLLARRDRSDRRDPTGSRTGTLLTRPTTDAPTAHARTGATGVTETEPSLTEHEQDPLSPDRLRRARAASSEGDGQVLD